MNDDEIHDFMDRASDRVYTALRCAAQGDIATADDLADALLKSIKWAISPGNA